MRNIRAIIETDAALGVSRSRSDDSLETGKFDEGNDVLLRIKRTRAHKADDYEVFGQIKFSSERHLYNLDGQLAEQRQEINSNRPILFLFALPRPSPLSESNLPSNSRALRRKNCSVSPGENRDVTFRLEAAKLLSLAPFVPHSTTSRGFLYTLGGKIALATEMGGASGPAVEKSAVGFSISDVQFVGSRYARVDSG